MNKPLIERQVMMLYVGINDYRVTLTEYSENGSYLLMSRNGKTVERARAIAKIMEANKFKDIEELSKVII